jgi:hypothetical protein
MSAGNVLRYREYRQRRKAGRIVITLEIDEVRSAQALVEANCLDPLLADDRDAIEQAAQKFWNIVCEERE